MAFSSDPSFHALHVVRIRGRAGAESVAAALDRADTMDLLRPLAAAGHVAYHTGRATGWSVTADGRQHHARLLAEERQSAGVTGEIRACYDAFLRINHALIEVCTAHQMRPDGAINDHTDAAYDGAVVERLAAVDADAQPICAALAASMTRFATYGRRMSTALAKVRAGERQWFTSLSVDSYHTVWFELHEDLLQTLGLERRAEGAG